MRGWLICKQSPHPWPYKSALTEFEYFRLLGGCEDTLMGISVPSLGLQLLPQSGERA